MRSRHDDSDRDLRVRSESRPQGIAGAVCWRLRKRRNADLVAIGPAAVNQAVKGAAIARSIMADEDLALGLVPSFESIYDADGQERTVMRLAVIVLSDGRDNVVGGRDD